MRQSLKSCIPKELTVFGRPQQRCPFATVSFRLLLLVSLWQGPIIWVHDHTPVDSRLAEHVARFHASESDPWNLGWHWHVSMPESRIPTSPEDSGRHQDPLDVAEVCGFVANFGNIGASGSTHLLLPLLSHLLPSAVMKLPAGVQNSCLHGFRSSRLTQHLLCRMSC